MALELTLGTHHCQDTGLGTGWWPSLGTPSRQEVFWHQDVFWHQPGGHWLLVHCGYGAGSLLLWGHPRGSLVKCHTRLRLLPLGRAPPDGSVPRWGRSVWSGHIPGPCACANSHHRLFTGAG